MQGRNSAQANYKRKQQEANMQRCLDSSRSSQASKSDPLATHLIVKLLDPQSNSKPEATFQ